MKSSYIALGYKCNHNCIICPLSTADRLHAPLSYSQIINAIDTTNLTEGDYVTLSGGEPTLNPFFMDLIQELVRRKIRITVLTNGIGFTNPEAVNRLAQMVEGYPFNAVIALHSADEKIHDTITRHTGSFADSVKAIYLLQNAGINVTIKHILCKMTVTGLCDLAKMIVQIFPPKVEIQFTSMDYSGRAMKQSESLKVTFAEVRNPLNAALDVLLHQTAQPYRVFLIEMPLCACDPKYWGNVHCLSNLGVYLAPNVETADKTIFDLPSQCAAQYPPCMECDVQRICPGTWRSAYDLLGSQLLTPIRCCFKKT